MNSSYIAPVVTAFDKNGGLDHYALKSIYDDLIRGGVDGILLLGSTGEFFAIPMETKKELIRLAVEHIKKRTQIIVGTASMEIGETVELSAYAHEQGADAVIVISPYYFSLSDQSVEAYYSALAEECRGAVYLYNFPERTGYDLTPEIALNLIRKYKNIIGYKDTVAGMDHTRELIKRIKPEFPDFKIYSGFDDNFAHNVLAGGDGCIAGLSNLVPEVCSAWVKAFKENDLEAVAAIQKTIDGLMSIYTIGKPFIPYIKKAMILREMHLEAFSTFPMPPVTESEALKLTSILERANLL